jgi:hypothetical protein
VLVALPPAVAALGLGGAWILNDDDNSSDDGRSRSALARDARHNQDGSRRKRAKLLDAEAERDVDREGGCVLVALPPAVAALGLGGAWILN